MRAVRLLKGLLGMIAGIGQYYGKNWIMGLSTIALGVVELFKPQIDKGGCDLSRKWNVVPNLCESNPAGTLIHTCTAPLTETVTSTSTVFWYGPTCIAD